MDAQCPNCGEIFNSGFSGINAKNFSGHVRTRCPNPDCRAVFTFLNGTYDFDEHGIATLLSGPEFTPDILIQLQELALATQRENLSAEQFKEKAEAISPIVGKLTRYINFNQPGIFLTWLNALLTVITLVIALKMQSPIISKRYASIECVEKEKTTIGVTPIDKDVLINVMSAPEFTYDILLKLRKLIDKTLTKKYTQEKFNALALKISPTLKAVIRLIVPTNAGEFWTMMGALAAIVGVAIAYKSKQENFLSARDAIRMRRRYNR